MNCADDDFIIPNSINKSIDFLENNLDYTCVHGNFISFFTKICKNDIKKFYWIPIYQLSESVEFYDPQDRLLYQFSHYMHTIYSVHRTDFLKMIFSENIKYTDDDRFGERLPSMLDVVYGKMKKLDILYSARERIINSTARTSKNIFDFINNGTYEKKYTKFRECLTKALVSEEGISRKKAQKLIDKAMNQHLGFPMSKSRLKARLKRIAGHNALLKKFYLAYRQFKTSKKQMPALDRLPPIEYSSKENLYHGDEDFIRIKEAVEKDIME